MSKRTVMLVILILGVTSTFSPVSVGAQSSGSCQATPADGLGPYYLPNSPLTSAIYPLDVEGQKLIVSGKVMAQDCTPLAGAVVDVWQADANGAYDFSDQFIGRGQVRTDANGRYWFQTIVPGKYEPRPRHIHFMITTPDGGQLVTQLYFAADNSGASAAQVIAPVQRGNFLRGRFDIVVVTP